MMKSLYFFFFWAGLWVNASGQNALVTEKDLNAAWLKFDDGNYHLLSEDGNSPGNTIYLKLETSRFPGRYLSVKSARPYFIFFNGRLAGQYHGRTTLKLDSLAMAHSTASILMAIHQVNINPRDLKTELLSARKPAGSWPDLLRPHTYFRDFVILAGLVITTFFMIVMRFNPKLASDYFSVQKIFSLRETDDAQSNARLTSGANIQFYVVCSLLLGFYMMVILYHLPDQYALPLYFQVNSFWSVVWQWLRISTVILGTFFLKIVLIYALTRLFGLRGMTRVHFFNWVRLLLIVFGVSSIILFVYFILHGSNENFFIVFLTLVIATLTAWILVVFLKLSSKSEHSMFHLFSYICATELIPLLITIKVLFQ
jgi:hypothetical protein